MSYFASPIGQADNKLFKLLNSFAPLASFAVKKIFENYCSSTEKATTISASSLIDR